MRAIRPNLHPVPASQEGQIHLGLPEGPAREIAAIVLTSLDDDKAENVVAIDLLGKTSIADAMIIASGRSGRQVAAMADHLVERLKAAGAGDVRVEGKAHADWVLIDAGDVVIHLFRPEVREFYNLEKMWDADRPMTVVAGA